jgi:uncharacterized membrane protein
MPRTVVTSAEPAGGDGLPEKLAKYVPAETLAFFVPISATIPDSRMALLWVAVAVGLVGTIIYLIVAAQRATADAKPRLHFFVLAGLAFLAWALGTGKGVQDLIGLDSITAGVILGVAVFLVPLIDSALNIVSAARRRSPSVLTKR